MNLYLHYVYIYIIQIVNGTEGHMAVDGPVCHPQSIIWTEATFFACPKIGPGFPIYCGPFSA